MNARRVLFVAATASQPKGWQADWGAVRAVAPGQVGQAVDGQRADVVLVDGELRDPVAAVREVHGIDPTLLPIVLTPPHQREQLQRALLFAPGIGETWIAVELDEALLERATAITARRRHFREVRERIAETAIQGGTRDVRPFLTDAYLAALLQVLPDATAAVDEQGRVLFWSPAAEQVLGTPAVRALGQPFHTLLDTDPALWGELLRRSATAPLRREVHYRSAIGEPRVAVLGLAPITIGGQRARAAMLHDVTDERRAHKRLLEQADTLEQQALELEERSAALARLAAEKDNLLVERERTLKELRHAIDVRSRFYASMNHEIRTPINAMLGYTDLLISGTYGQVPAAQLRALQQSKSAAQHLIGIVNDLLDMSRLEAGRMDLQIAPVRVEVLINDLIDTARPLASASGSELLPQVGDGCPVSIITDPRRARQILLNLVSNAVKFGEGKPIYIRCQGTAEGGVAVEVVDAGIGIADEDLPHIFEEFVQVGGKSTSGTGLGLTISARLAALLGGKLSARSRLGEGSTFSLELPLKAPLLDD